jgi:hypothetical protein
VYLALLSPATGSSQEVDGVNIISQNYSVSATYGATWEANTPYHTVISGEGTTNTSANDGTPINISYSNPVPPPIPTQDGASLGHGNASISSFSYSTYGFGVDGETLFLGTDGNSYSPGNGFAGITAQASWLFRPTVSNLQITLNLLASFWVYPGDQSLSMTLSDVTSSSTLLAYSENGNPNSGGIGLFSILNTYAFSLNPNDTYQLSISGLSYSDAFDAESQDVTASFTVVPESATISFFTFGIIIFTTTRKCVQMKLNRNYQSRQNWHL